MGSLFKLVWAVFFFLVASGVAVTADEVSDQKEAQQVSQELDAVAKSEGSRSNVEKRLAGQFKVDSATINELRARKMGYGEISMALSLAQQMPGGASKENIQKVMSVRQEYNKVGWGDVAKQLGVDLGKSVGQVKKMAKECKAKKEGKSSQAKEKKQAGKKAQEKVKPVKSANKEKAASAAQAQKASKGKGKKR